MAGAGSVGFPDFLKENEPEVWGFRVQHEMPLLVKPHKGVSRAHLRAH